jgi:hypothetical protein
VFTGPWVSLVIAEFAKVTSSDLTVIGAGISVRDPDPEPMTITVNIRFPRNQMEIAHDFVLFLVDDKGELVTLSFDDGTEVTAIPSTIGPVAGLPEDQHIKTPFETAAVMTTPPFSLDPGRSYAWQAQFDGETRPEWTAPFRTTPPGVIAP